MIISKLSVPKLNLKFDGNAYDNKNANNKSKVHAPSTLINSVHN